MDLFIQDIFGKDSPSVEGLDVDCFQADETVVAQQRTQPPTSVLRLIYSHYLLSLMKRGMLQKMRFSLLCTKETETCNITRSNREHYYKRLYVLNILHIMWLSIMYFSSALCCIYGPG